MINPVKALTDISSPGILVIGQSIDLGDSLFDKSGEIVNFELGFVNLLRPSNNVNYSLTAISDNFDFLQTTGTLPNLGTYDTTLSIGQSIEIELFASNDSIEDYIARIDYSDANGYKDHDYIFFQMKPSEVTQIASKYDKNIDLQVFPTNFDNLLSIEGQIANGDIFELWDFNCNKIMTQPVNQNSTFTVNLPDSIPAQAYVAKVISTDYERTFKVVKTAP
jgi:hypothetical protein